MFELETARTPQRAMLAAVAKLRPFQRTISSSLRSAAQLAAELDLVFSVVAAASLLTASLKPVIDSVRERLSVLIVVEQRSDSAVPPLQQQLTLQDLDMLHDRLRSIRQEVVAVCQPQPQHDSADTSGGDTLAFAARVASILVFCADVIAAASADADLWSVSAVQRSVASLHEIRSLLALVSDLPSASSIGVASDFLREVDVTLAFFSKSPTRSLRSLQAEEDAAVFMRVADAFSPLAMCQKTASSLSFLSAVRQLYWILVLDGVDSKHFRPPEALAALRKRLVHSFAC
jgi:hypothetical protein